MGFLIHWLAEIKACLGQKAHLLNLPLPQAKRPTIHLNYYINTFYRQTERLVASRKQFLHIKNIPDKAIIKTLSKMGRLLLKLIPLLLQCNIAHLFYNLLQHFFLTHFENLWLHHAFTIKKKDHTDKNKAITIDTKKDKYPIYLI